MRRLSWLYSQNDPAWAGLQLGRCPGVTMGADGCDTTVAAMVLSDFGYTISPGDLMALLVNDSIYVDEQGNPGGCLLPDDGLTRVHSAPGDLALSCQVFDFSAGPADLSLLTPPTDATQVAIEIANGPNIPSHRMRVAYSWAGAGAPADCILVDDPWQAPGTTRRLWKDSLGAGAEPAVAIQKVLWYSGIGTH